MPCQSISILGCGWLGFPLAKRLLKTGMRVRGSTTQRDRLKVLRASGIEAYEIQCKPELSGQSINSFFSSDILFVNIPFKRRLKDPQYYARQIFSVMDQVIKSDIHFVIFASSTAVYPDTQGWVDENSSVNLDSPRAKVLAEVENKWFQIKTFQTTIIRFAGLYGPDREIHRFMDRAQTKSSGAPLNLIHLDDCIGIVETIIRQNVRGKVYNACSDEHPVRQALYERAARKNGLNPPQFDDRRKAQFKLVSNHKLKSELKYQFRYPDPLKAV